MKKTAIILCSLALSLALLAGCGSSGSQDNPSTGKVSVITTIFAPYDFAREIAGDKADITMLLPPASESHSYEPTPKDIIKIQNCDIFIYTGGESDSWVNEILESMDTGNMRIISLLDCVTAKEEEIVEGMEAPHDEDDHDDEHGGEPEYDEHVWTSPKNAKEIVQEILAALCQADDENSAAYTANVRKYSNRLDDLDLAFQAAVDSAARKTLVFGDRFPFRYFADAYGLKYFAAFPGCSTDTEPSAATVAFLIDKVKSEEIPVVFHAELSNQKMANVISEATGAKVLLLHACHNITKTEFENGTSYIELMWQNVDNLKEALN